jgi:hypothetical protein
MALGSVLVHQLLKLGPWKKLEQLAEDAARSRHGAVPPGGVAAKWLAQLATSYEKVQPFFISS